MQTKISAPTKQNTYKMQAYAPSFLDRFMQFIQRLPIPYWLTYLLLFILESVINHVLGWLDGWLPAFTFNGMLLLFPLWQWGTLAIIIYLNITSEATLSSFRPLLDSNDDELKKIKYEFTNMPSRGVILSGVAWIFVYLLLTYSALNTFYVILGIGNFFRAFSILEGLIAYSTGSVIYYHSLRQLWLVNRTVKMVKRFNMFELDPVYSFSSLTARTGISWMIMLGLTLLLFPLELAKGPILGLLVFQVVLALAAFVLPLGSVNSHLVTEKHRLLAELDQRIELTLDRLHHCLDKNESGAEQQLYYGLIGLQTERRMLMDISTWPWRTATFTGFLSAIILPIALLFIQIVVQKWLGG